MAEPISFLVNTALSLGLSLIGAWLSPKKSSTTQEGVPVLGSGNPLFYCWGDTFSPTQPFYSVPASKAGHNNDFSTYGMIGFCNPDATAKIRALRVNDFTVSSLDNLFPLNLPNDVRNEGDVYTNGAGMRTYNGLNIGFQMTNSEVFNPDFETLGYGGLRYNGLTWLRVAAAERKIYGGNSARQVWYVSNAIESSFSESFNVNNSQPVEILHALRNGGRWYDIVFNYPTGFYGTRIVDSFENGKARYDVVGIGGDREFIIWQGIPEINEVKFKVNTPIAPGGAPTLAGFYSRFMLADGQQNQGITNRVTVGALNQQVREIILAGSHQTPFRGDGTTIRDSGNNIIGTKSSSEKVYGWGGRMFRDTSNFIDAIIAYPGFGQPGLQAPIFPSSLPRSGSRIQSQTTLQRIITDIFKEKGAQSVSSPFFNVAFQDRNGFTLPLIPIRGFTSTLGESKNTLLNLATAFSLLVDEFSIPGTIIFKEYPDGLSIARAYTLIDLIEEAEIEFTNESEQPDALEFSYRNWERKLEETSITVGYGQPFPNKTSYRLDLALSETEARKLAWTMLFLTSHTNTAVKIRVNNLVGVTIGNVITLDIGGGEVMKLVVGGIEIGIDLTAVITCVNFVPIYQLLNGTIIQRFSDYMLGGTVAPSSGGQSAFSFEPVRFILDCEPTLFSNFLVSGSLFYTTDSSTYQAFDSQDTSVLQKLPITGGCRGNVEQIVYPRGSSQYGIFSISISLVPGTNFVPTIGLMRIGKTWLNCQAVTLIDGLYLLTGLSLGLFGSSPYISATDVLTQLTTTNFGNPISQSNSQIGLGYVAQSTKRIAPSFRTPAADAPNGYPYGQVTSEYPYGTPFSGVATANAIVSYYNGVLKLWVANPGSQNNGFFLNNSTGGNTITGGTWWVKSSTGVSTFLGLVGASGYQEFNVTVAAGGGVVYQAPQSGGVNQWGSFVFNFS